ncbi:pyocin knob domain-containing protein [Bacteroides acidifaciens]|jgi:hypothetical protein|uniref:pyocin knob domain-containing protein n=1 Tax=Bacteroides acidifaciens TaxID=85831 RepID=UPI0025B4D1E4|nr:pyocin knob domain-containing protein [Bacteroides acidifaciens]
MSDRTVEATNAILKRYLTDTVTYRGIATDFDLLTESGIYYVVRGGSVGVPSGAYDYGVLVTLNASLFIAQLYIPHYKAPSGHNLYSRVWYSSGWKPWQGYDSVEEIPAV